MTVLLLVLACAPPVLEPEPVALRVVLENVSAPGALETSDGQSLDMMLAPGILVVHAPGWRLFEPGASAEGFPGLEQLAEDGDPAALFEALEQVEAVSYAAVVGPVDDVTYDSLPLLPGEQTEERFTVAAGQRLTVASMFGESNDVFLATDPAGLPLEAQDGALSLFDAGTELNQEPGVGEDQAPRQEVPGQGEAEEGVVTEVEGSDAAGYGYPSAPDLATLTVFMGEE